MTLYCFIFGMAAFAAVRENKQFLYGAFCILLAVLTNFQRAGFECVFTVLVLLAVQNPQGVGLAENQKFAQAVEFVGAVPGPPAGAGAAAQHRDGRRSRVAVLRRGICRLPDGVLCAVYAFCAPV